MYNVVSKKFLDLYQCNANIYIMIPVNGQTCLLQCFFSKILYSSLTNKQMTHHLICTPVYIHLIYILIRRSFLTQKVHLKEPVCTMTISRWQSSYQSAHSELWNILTTMLALTPFGSM